jgi:xanthine dehydrogenase accessory factor
MSPRALAAAAQQWRAAGRAAAVVEVAASRGSVPRGAGTRMLVAADEVLGTIGGGHLELKAIEEARGLVARGGGPALDLHLPLGQALGQCCGGAVSLHIVMLAGHDPARWPVPPPLFMLQLYGAGHVGRAIVRLLEAIDCQVQWIDERENPFPLGPPAAPAPHIERICVEPVQAEVAAAPPGAFYLVLTHRHDLDLAITMEIIKRGDFGFFGLIGSKTKRARFEHRLQERGIAPELLARMTCPIGIAGIRGREPEVIAVAVVAQLLQQAG